MNKEKILGFNVCTNSSETILKNYMNKNKVVIASLNPEIIIKNYKDKEFIKKINSQKYQIPDGIGIVYASKKQNGKVKKRIAGIDLMQSICAKSVSYNAKIFYMELKLALPKKQSKN